MHHPFQRRNEANKSTLQEAEERCPEETKKRCFERVNEMLLRRDNESKQKKGQRYLISQSPLMVRDGSVIFDELETPEILKSLNFIELHEDSHVSDAKSQTQVDQPLH